MSNGNMTTFTAPLCLRRRFADGRMRYVRVAFYFNRAQRDVLTSCSAGGATSVLSNCYGEENS
eukprot:scaffold679543_cov60-Prasinocladus_malaysianus.AAC.1